jgi:heat-inducible transcriptional repressor
MSEESLSLDAITERQRSILRIVVEQYVETAQPVGSAAIVNHHDLGVSPATVRNELAALEKHGLLTHPHTSAGRIPTDLGFRFFVRHLLADTALAPREQETIRQQFSLARQEMDQWLHLSTTVLARATQGAALATAPRSTRCRFKHMELVHINATKVLLILVLQEGAVKQQLLDLDAETEQDELSRISNELNAQLAGGDSAAVAANQGKFSPFGSEVAAVVLDTMQRFDLQGSGQVFRDGLAEMLRLPEFAEGPNVRKIVQVLEQPSVLEQIGESYSERGTVHVVIAGDGRYEQLRDVSIVLSRYGVNDRVTGLLGVIGPVRMWYDRSIGAVRFVSDLMSEMVEELYGP